MILPYYYIVGPIDPSLSSNNPTGLTIDQIICRVRSGPVWSGPVRLALSLGRSGP